MEPVGAYRSTLCKKNSELVGHVETLFQDTRAFEKRLDAANFIGTRINADQWRNHDNLIDHSQYEKLLIVNSR